MKLIAHRGNINGKINTRENTQLYIQEAIDKGYDVEVDVWYKDNKFWLGHDYPEIKTDLNWLLKRQDSLWVHCKNFKALTQLIKTNLKLFYHEKEDYTIISNKCIWAHNLNNIDDKCIIPLLSKEDINNWKPKKVLGICSDYIELLK
jgi:glycerophosphoryl diester phosphodiesterase